MRAFRLAYDGRPYHGFQRQPDVSTVEGTFLAALDELDVVGSHAELPPGYAAAGRTDAGVSALAQTVAFECPDWCTPRALNGELPDAIRAWASADVSETFHATHDAVRRAYTYFLLAPEADLDVARSVADQLSGEHDFHNLTPDDRGTVRELSITVDLRDGVLELTVASDGFPRQLVRRLASLVGAVASGDASLDRVDWVLSSEPLEGPDGVPAAPGEGLVLTAVDYSGVAFEIDGSALDGALAAFSDRAWVARRRAAAMERVLDGLGEGT